MSDDERERLRALCRKLLRPRIPPRLQRYQDIWRRQADDNRPGMKPGTCKPKPGKPKPRY
jgi:hypothetical protein